MFVAACRVTLHIPNSQSLKDKRQVVRSLLQRLRNTFGVAAAEVADQDKRQLATLGLASVSGDAGHAEEVLDSALRYVEETRPDIAVSSTRIELLSLEA
jgi:uncharacterized protein YlxP (DUF503 family)